MTFIKIGDVLPFTVLFSRGVVPGSMRGMSIKNEAPHHPDKPESSTSGGVSSKIWGWEKSDVLIPSPSPPILYACDNKQAAIR